MVGLKIQHGLKKLPGWIEADVFCRLSNIRAEQLTYSWIPAAMIVSVAVKVSVTSLWSYDVNGQWHRVIG